MAPNSVAASHAVGFFWGGGDVDEWENPAGFCTLEVFIVDIFRAPACVCACCNVSSLLTDVYTLFGI